MAAAWKPPPRSRRGCNPRPADHILDIGSGIGGPARHFAARFGCRVSGIDLTPEFCEVARHLSRLLGLAQKTEFHVGDALAMPFADASFDGAYSMNVSMNIADKAAFYREIRRVLKPGAWLLLSEIARGSGAEMDFPTPWASSAARQLPVHARRNAPGPGRGRLRGAAPAQHAGAGTRPSAHARARWSSAARSPRTAR